MEIFMKTIHQWLDGMQVKTYSDYIEVVWNIKISNSMYLFDLYCW